MNPPEDPRAAGDGVDGSARSAQLSALGSARLSALGNRSPRRLPRSGGLEAKHLNLAPQRLVPAEHRTCTGCGTTWNIKARRKRASTTWSSGWPTSKTPSGRRC